MLGVVVRLKVSGMRWNIRGATAIRTLRCHQASDRWEHIWTRSHNQTPPPTHRLTRTATKITNRYLQI